jgi:UDP-3-O-[3-hydroxymyristoyl] N-acetylglucosamine deacetylase
VKVWHSLDHRMVEHMSELKGVEMKFVKQTTLSERATLIGNGVHSNAPVQIVLHPADANHGIVFLRTGLADGRERLIEARHSLVSATELCTVLGEDSSGSVATIEHLMAAIVGLGLDNVLVEIDGPEMPILDGSSAEFVDAIDRAGLVTLSTARKFVRVLRPVRVSNGRAFAELKPYDRGFRLDVEIDFDTPIIGRQRKVFELTPSGFRKEIARARTFGFMRDVERLWKAGFALGASLDNTVAIGDDAVINPEGLRWSDEFVRHKTLDAIGDLALAGHQLLGDYRSYCGGHGLNVAVVEALFADRANYAIVESAPRREPAYAELSSAAAAYAPDTH